MAQLIRWCVALLAIALAPLGASHATDIKSPSQAQIQALRMEIAWGSVLMRHLESCDATRTSALQAELTKQQAIWKSRAAMLDLPADEVDEIRQQSLVRAKKEWAEASAQQRAAMCKELLDNVNPTTSNTAPRD